MDKKIGDLIKRIRIDNGYSQQELSDLIPFSREIISKIENNKRIPSKDFLLCLRNILQFDFLTLYKYLDDFKSIEHYTLYYKIVLAIEQRNFTTLSNLAQTQIFIYEFNYGKPEVLRTYVQSILLIYVDKNYSLCLNLCLNFFNLKQENIEEFIPELDKDKYYYSLLLSLSYSLNELSLLNIQLNFESNIVVFLEKYYFNDMLPLSSIELNFKKFYLAILNNIADTYFKFQEFDTSLSICLKVFKILQQANLLSMLPLITRLTIENHYMLGNILEAKQYLVRFEVYCFTCNINSYYDSTILTFKNKYPKLFI